MILPTYKPALITNEEWKEIWDLAMAELQKNPMFALKYSEIKDPRPLKFSFLRTAPQNPDLPERTVKLELEELLERESIKFNPTTHYIVRVYIEKYKKDGIAIFEMWDKTEKF